MGRKSWACWPRAELVFKCWNAHRLGHGLAGVKDPRLVRCLGFFLAGALASAWNLIERHSLP
jgi:hypothetical protein